VRPALAAGHLVTAHAETAGAQLSDTALLVAVAAAIGVVYWVGVRRLRPRSGGAIGGSWWWRRWCFVAGLAVVVAALLPLIDPVVDRSFPLHMTQHLVLMFLAAPLLALGAPGLPLQLALPRGWRRRVAALRGARAVRQGRALLTLPALMLLASTALLCVWHLPDLYNAALENDTVHELEHFSFLVAGGLLWFPLTTPDRPLDGGRAVLYVFVSGFPTAALGAILTLAPRPIYPQQTGTGPGALTAQQLAGVLMWIPSTFFAVLLCAGLMLWWFRGMERSAPGTAPLPSPEPPPLPVTAMPRIRRAGRATVTRTTVSSPMTTGEVPR
jgi:putative membrane protein